MFRDRRDDTSSFQYMRHHCVPRSDKGRQLSRLAMPCHAESSTRQPAFLRPTISLNEHTTQAARTAFRIPRILDVSPPHPTLITHTCSPLGRCLSNHNFLSFLRVYSSEGVGENDREPVLGARQRLGDSLMIEKCPRQLATSSTRHSIPTIAYQL